MSQFGLDEAGRGPWAGPIFVSIVSISKPIKGLDDSKKLTAKQREVLYEEILKKADYIGIGASSSKYIDRNGLTKATIYASDQALQKLGPTIDHEFIIDGVVDYLPGVLNKRCVVKADSKFQCVSAASIVAKVCRDRYMTNLAKKYSVYGFEKHFGYGTKAHKQAIEENGLCPEHRLSFKPIAEYA